MATYIYDTPDICLPCLFMAANDDDISEPGDPTPLNKILPGMDIFPAGIEGEDPTFFGTADCPACGQHLAGDRHPAVILTSEPLGENHG